jgi:hypothetical protein
MKQHDEPVRIRRGIRAARNLFSRVCGEQNGLAI